MLCLVGDSGKIVIFAIFARFAIMFSFLPFLLLRAFLDISRKLPEVHNQSNGSRFHGAIVSTLDSESSGTSSNLSGTCKRLTHFLCNLGPE